MAAEPTDTPVETTPAEPPPPAEAAPPTPAVPPVPAGPSPEDIAREQAAKTAKIQSLHRETRKYHEQQAALKAQRDAMREEIEAAKAFKTRMESLRHDPAALTTFLEKEIGENAYAELTRHYVSDGKPDPQRAVDGEPAHHLRVDVVPRRDTGLPDAVVGLVPPAGDGLDHVIQQLDLPRLHLSSHEMEPPETPGGSL